MAAPQKKRGIFALFYVFIAFLLSGFDALNYAERRKKFHGQGGQLYLTATQGRLYTTAYHPQNWRTRQVEMGRCVINSGPKSTPATRSGRRFQNGDQR